MEVLKKIFRTRKVYLSTVYSNISSPCFNVSQRVSPVAAGFVLLLLPQPLLAPAPLPSLPRARVRVHRTARNLTPSVTDPGEVLLPGNGPGFEVLLVLRYPGERHWGRVVVFPGLIDGLLPRPERSPGPCSICGYPGGAGPCTRFRGGDLFGDGAHLLVADVGVVLGGERDREVRFVQLVPEASQAADSGDTRPSHASRKTSKEGGGGGEEEGEKGSKRENHYNHLERATFLVS